MGKIRGTHSSPGIYTQITDVEYTTRNAGITTLGLVGETLKGPAFEPIDVKDWPEFVTYFGGTSTEKFKDSQYPKYELPYIAQSYLAASDQLKVCRVLGLSGYHAGPAFVITASKSDDTADTKYVVAVLRSRGQYRKYGTMDPETCTSTYDKLEYRCKKITLSPYKSLSTEYSCDGSLNGGSAVTEDFKVTSYDKGKFIINAYADADASSAECTTYAVSLNPGAKDYIYNVIGSDAQKGSADVFIEELYDAMLEDLILKGKVDQIDAEVVTFEQPLYIPVTEPVADFLTIPENSLGKRQVGMTFVYAEAYAGEIDSANTECFSSLTEGGIYTVESKYINNVKKYVYSKVVDEKDNPIVVSATTATTGELPAVYVLSIDSYVVNNEENGISILPTNLDDYQEQYRYASTPWVVSELRGSMAQFEVKKLFRFHTITDGNNANDQVKISIANIRPDDGTFDVYVRDFYDTDSNPTILESYKGVNLVPGTSKYLGLKIGTIDGAYETVSKYVLVEIADDDTIETCVPAGFLGYPVRNYGEKLTAPYFVYNTVYDEDVKAKRQYFGLSDITGVDVDMLSYKGKQAYTEEYNIGYTNAFHLDARISALDDVPVYVDGEIYEKWETVSTNNVTSEKKIPIIASEAEMEGTIFENTQLRKFTLYPYGGFDGWDIYRSSRTNTNEFKANKYKGSINGAESAFANIIDGTALALSGRCITSDYYAYLAGINQFENPEKEEINLFATPGIDYVNNELLVSDAIDMVENRLDTFYVVTTPDKPWGASDNVSEMFSSSDVADNLDDTSVNTYYAATYYPWVKYFDRANNIYTELPATKDAVRIMANIDNKRFPWIAPAGVERASVDCKKMHFYAKLEDRDNVYDSRINPLMSFKEGVKIWGNKTLYISEETNPMNRINAVRLMLYLRRLVIASSIGLIFEGNDDTLKDQFEGNIRPLLSQVKADRGVTDYDLKTSQTPEQMDAHELSGVIYVKPTPTLEYIELQFVVTPQGVRFEDIS